jgi:hypothetical protein
MTLARQAATRQAVEATSRPLARRGDYDTVLRN